MCPPARVVKIGQRQLDAADVDVQSELFSLYENTMVSKEESDADVQLAMKKFRATNLTNLKKFELERKDGLRVKAENK